MAAEGEPEVEVAGGAQNHEHKWFDQVELELQTRSERLGSTALSIQCTNLLGLIGPRCRQFGALYSYCTALCSYRRTLLFRLIERFDRIESIESTRLEHQ